MLADLSLARRLERAEATACARFVESHARLEPEAGAAWIDVGGAYAMFDGRDSPVTQCFGLGIFGEANDADLDRIEGFFFERGAACHVEISPLAGVALTRRLVERGYLPEEQSNLLFQPLPRLAGGGDSGIRVRVPGPDEEAVWAEVSLEGWRDSAPPEVLEYLRTIGPIVAGCEGYVRFLAEADGKPAGAGALSLHEGVALLAGACTVPEARRRGVQRALLEARLAYAAEQGCDLAQVVCEPGSSSQRNAQRQGFSIAYTRTKWALASL